MDIRIILAELKVIRGPKVRRDYFLLWHGSDFHLEKLISFED